MRRTLDSPDPRRIPDQARGWRQMPSMNDDYAHARPDMDAWLDQLLAELEARP